jgi:hypothetical protein
VGFGFGSAFVADLVFATAELPGSRPCSTHR